MVQPERNARPDQGGQQRDGRSSQLLDPVLNDDPGVGYTYVLKSGANPQQPPSGRIPFYKRRAFITVVLVAIPAILGLAFSLWAGLRPRE